MKLHKSLLIFGVSALLLSACADDGGSADEEVVTEPETEEVVEAEDTKKEQENTDVTDDEITSEEDSAGTVDESEIGTLTNVSGNVEVNETIENGPFTITVEYARTSQLQPSEDYVDIFGGEDLAMVSFNVNVANNSEDTNAIYPDQGILVTNTGAQVDAELFLSDDVGGDFYGEVTKSGAVHFIFDGNAEEIENVRYIINSGSDENYDSFGDDLEFSIDF